MARILIIDDDIQVRNILKRTFEQEGFEVTDAPDGEKGIKLFHQEQPDVVITDIVMPEKEGLETIMELHRENPKLKIIAISGGGLSINGGNSLFIAGKIGAHRTFIKPFDRKEIVEAVRELLETNEK